MSMTNLITFALAFPLATYATSKSSPKCQNFTVISHRGFSGLHPEESEIAYKSAADLGTDFLEMDVHRTKDNVLIVNHDNTFERTTDISSVYPSRATNLIATFTFAEISKLKNKGVPILKLEDVIKISLTHPEHPGLYIESKSPELYPGVEKQIVDLLSSQNAFKKIKVIFQSFDIESIKKFKALRAEIPRVYLTENTIEKMIKEDIPLAVKFANGIGPNLDEVKPADLKSFMNTVHQQKLFAHFWTVDALEKMNLAIDSGADGVFTNRSDILMNLCGKMRLKSPERP